MLEEPRPVLMVIDRACSYHAQVAAGLASALRASGISLIVHVWGVSGTPAPSPLVPLLHEGGLGAVIVTPLSHAASDRSLAAVLDLVPDLPRVHLGVAAGQASARCDNEEGMQLMARHVVEDCGARRPLVVRGRPHQNDSLEREAALIEELVRLGVAAGDAR